MQTLFASFLILWATTASGLEEPSPEVFLQPRNFNPHPYELGYASLAAGGRQEKRLQEYANRIDNTRRGPVLFPPNANDAGAAAAVAAAPRFDVNSYDLLAHLKDTHPYAGVAAKHKQKYTLGRFVNTPEPINSQVYKALARHGAKVLNVPQAKDLKDTPNLQEIDYDYNDESKKNYAFSYKVVDHSTGDDFSHKQSQDSHATNGEYRVKLPDGRLQIVSYTVDKNGYKADVKYAEDGGGSSHGQQELNAPVHVPFYADSVLATDEDAALGTHADDNFINQELIARAPYYDDHGYYHHQQQQQQHKPAAISRLILPAIGGGGASYRDTLLAHKQAPHGGGKFIAATLAPPAYVETLSTLAPDLDRFNPAYIETNKYKR